MIILLEKTTLIKSKKEEEEVIPILSHTSRKHYLVYILDDKCEMELYKIFS